MGARLALLGAHEADRWHDSCEATHLIYAISGKMHVVMNDGTEGDIGPGDFASISPGHDAWVVGEEPFVGVDFGGYAQYAKG